MSRCFCLWLFSVVTVDRIRYFELRLGSVEEI